MKTLHKQMLLLTFFICISTFAQGTSDFDFEKKVRVNLYAAYTFDDSFDSYYDYGNYYSGTIKGGLQYGGGLEFKVTPRNSVELLYLRQDTHAPTYYYGGGLFDKSADFNMDMNYIMIGGLNSFQKPGSKVEGFGGFMLGVGIVNIENPTNHNSDSLTKFAWGLKAGATIWATEKVGLKLQGQLLSIAQSVGGGMYFGTGGAGAGVSTYSSIYQFTLGGGLVFELGK
ncbi:MAG: hypothetical protein ACI7YS_03885 [Flavobacterium sp.]